MLIDGASLCDNRLDRGVIWRVFGLLSLLDTRKFILRHLTYLSCSIRRVWDMDELADCEMLVFSPGADVAWPSCGVGIVWRIVKLERESFELLRLRRDVIFSITV